MPEPEDVHVDDHRVFKTYLAVGGVILVALLNHFKLIPDALAGQLIAILLGLAVAAMRYGQVKDAVTVKTALVKQAAVVKEAVLQVAIKDAVHEEQEAKDKCDARPTNYSP